MNTNQITKTLTLKKQYIMSEEEKQEANYLNVLFTNQNNTFGLHTYLDPDHKKALPKDIITRIDNLFFKYLDPLRNIDWHDPFEMELKDLKQNDRICGRNNNKKYWVKAYMLNWIADLPKNPSSDWLFAHIVSRESFQRIIRNVYDYE